MAPAFEPHEIPATDIAAHAVESVKELRRARLIQWCVRSAITAPLLWWLSTKFPWVRTVFYIWAAFAVLSLFVLIFLPSIVSNRIRALESKMTEGLDLGGAGGLGGLGGMPGMGEPMDGPRDVEVDDVSDGHVATLELPAGSRVPDVVPVSLEDQLAELETFGIRLSAGVTVDDVCHSIERNELESQPYELLVSLLGGEVEREPFGRAFSERLWSFDSECIEGDGSYNEIVERVAGVAGKRDSVQELADSVDLDRGEATLRYSINGSLRKFRPEVVDDWADPAVVQSIADDFADIDRGLYGLPNGQVTTMVSLDREDADRFRALFRTEVLELA